MSWKSLTLVATVLATTSFATAKVDLIPRVKQKKQPSMLLELNDETTGRVIIKFVDSARARVSGHTINLLDNQDGGVVGEILSNHNIRATPGIRATEEQLQAVLLRAQALSNREQPDLGGIMYLEGPLDRIESAARELNELDLVEYVHMETLLYPGGDKSKGPRGYTGPGSYERHLEMVKNDAPLFGGRDIDPAARVSALAPEKRPANIASQAAEGDQYFGMDPECGEMGTGNCWEADGNGSPFCEDLACCDLIGELDPICIDENFGEWDQFCAAVANLLCGQHTPNTNDPPDGMLPNDPPTGPDRCSAGIASVSCFEPHFFGGCASNICCNTVCLMEPFCCDAIWDQNCVLIATELYPTIDANPLLPPPDFTEYQGYKTFAPLDAGGFPNVINELGVPTDAMGNPRFGHDFGGFDVDVLSTLADDLVADGVDRYGMGNITNGVDMQVAILEWGCYVNHHDLVARGGLPAKCILEPGQTMFLRDDIDEPNHGTACASIVVGRDEVTDLGTATPEGVTGIVPQAQGFFFPIYSREEGPRELSAWFNAIAQLRAGDVMSASYGGGNNNNFNPALNTVYQVATSLGISVCISAGNDCVNLIEQDDPGDPGSFVIGAGSPGANTPFQRPYRLSFSNYARDQQGSRLPNGQAIGNSVSLTGWGGFACAAGYGDLSSRDDATGNPDPLFSYTGFGGTSAASPQVAGVLAAFQGFAKQWLGYPLPVVEMRDLLEQTGTAPLDDIRMFGIYEPEGGPCALDLTTNAGINEIGAWPNLAGDFGSAASRLINTGPQGSDDSPYLENIAVLTGDDINGTVFSVRGSDDAYLTADPVRVVQSQTVGGGSGLGGGGGTPAPPGAGMDIPEVGGLRYLLTADVVDVVALARVGDPSSVNGGNVQVEMRSIGTPGVAFLEAFNWSTRQWEFVSVVPFGTIGGGGGDEFVFPPNALGAGIELPAHLRWVEPDDGRIYVRFYTAAIPGIGGPVNPGFYNFRMDLFQINLNVGLDTGLGG